MSGLRPVDPAFGGSGDFDAGEADVVVWGVPTDCGAGTGKMGAAAGPGVIRAASNIWNTIRTSGGFEFPKHGKIVDLGDVDLDGVARDKVHDAIRTAAPGMPAGRLTVAIGGDHSVTLPILESSDETWGLIYFDAHPDCIEQYGGDPRSHACVLKRLVEAGRVDPAHSIIVGMRVPEAEEVAWLQDRGVETVTSWQVYRVGIEEVCAHALERAADLPRYLSIDMDVLDAACVPGVENPETGGLSSREMLRACELLAGEVRALDLVEVTDGCDPAEITAKAAARILLDLVGGHIQKRMTP
jgi:agmatinase